MAEKIVLRFQYVGDDIDIVVDDVDKAKEEMIAYFVLCHFRTLSMLLY
ncbi:hypothetical protein BVRB_2g042960 [Beta vulgaris subsp. vulgaris]|nr:hypothetical protein BVRB_2g042960 [Beta vulgaris subsp. vulgaris]